MSDWIIYIVLALVVVWILLRIDERNNTGK